MLPALLMLAILSPAPAPFIFLQGTDTQFGMYTGDKGFEQETANFERLVAVANRLRPKFVVITGDLVNKAGDTAQIAEYKRIAATLAPGIPLYSVPGNHDVGNEPTPESLALYRQNFGPDYYAFRAGDVAGIVLDAPVIAHPENVPEELAKQEDWLRRELEKARSERVKHIIVFQHQPWFVESPDEEDSYHNIPKARRARYLDLLQSYGVRYVFAGHLHHQAIAHAGGIEIVASAPTGMPLGKERSGYTVVTVRDGVVEHRYEEFAGAAAGSAGPRP